MDLKWKSIILLMFAIHGVKTSVVKEIPSASNNESATRSYALDGKDFKPLETKEIQIQPQPKDIPEDCPKRCPVNTVQAGQKCYRFVDRKLNWTDAKADCKEQGGYLAIPEFTNPLFAVQLGAVYRDIIGKKWIWIGATDMESVIVWRWVDGTTLSPSNPNWYPGHPGNLFFSSCAEINIIKRGTLQMVKEKCSNERSYLCQFDQET